MENFPETERSEGAHFNLNIFNKYYSPTHIDLTKYIGHLFFFSNVYVRETSTLPRFRIHDTDNKHRSHWQHPQEILFTFCVI